MTSNYFSIEDNESFTKKKDCDSASMGKIALKKVKKNLKILAANTIKAYFYGYWDAYHGWIWKS